MDGYERFRHKHLNLPQPQKLRELETEFSIKDTGTLVSAYNDASGAHEHCHEFLLWIKEYIPVFERGTHLESCHEAMDFAKLANIIPKGPRETRLLQDAFDALSRKIHWGDYGEEDLIPALSSFLLSVDSKAFQGNAHQLTRLARDVMAKLGPEATFSRGTYPTHSVSLFALHHLGAVIHEVDPTELDHGKQDGLFQQMDQCLENIVNTQSYYPFCYQATLTRQSLASMDSNRGISSKEIWRRLFHALRGGVYFYQALAELATAKVDLESLDKCVEELTEAFARHSIKSKEWFEIVQELINFRMLVQKDPEELKNFQGCLERVDEVVNDTKSKEDQLALRYTMIRQVTLLALDCHSEEIRDWAVGEFFNFGTSLAQRKGWTADVRTLEALLDAALEIQQKDEFAEEMVKVIDHMKCYFQTNKQSETIANWLHVTNWNRDVKTMTKSQGKQDDILFNKIKAELSIDESLATSTEVQQELKKKYEQESEVPSLFDNEAPKHVQRLHHSLMLCRKDHMTSIALEDLFKDRELTSGKGVERVKQVFLFGNPGTGKTTIAKKIAYLWSIGDWGDAFKSLYLVPIKELVSTSYNDDSRRKRRNLQTAITNTCFSGKDDDEYASLKQQVKEDLDKDSTLVMFDGFDEGETMTKEMMKSVESKSCRVMVLSRPRNVQSQKDSPNLEVECMGMDDKQLIKFIKWETSSNELETSSIYSETSSNSVESSSHELVDHLQRHPSIWEIAHVPVVANILTFLYKTKKESIISEDFSLDMFSLYWKMSLEIWNRYVNKTKSNIKYKKMFKALEEIAFRALEDGHILIDQHLVHEISSNGEMRDVLKDCGFLLLKKEGFFYQFPHLTFQEFFAGQYMARCLMSKDYERKQKAVDFMTEHKYCANFRQMLCFMIQACVVKKGDRGYQEMELFIDAAPIALGYQQHLVLKLELLEAALSASKHQDRDRILNSTKLLEIALESSKRRIWGNRKFLYNPLASEQYAHTFAAIIDYMHSWDKFRTDVFPKVAKVARYDSNQWKRVRKMLRTRAKADDDDIVVMCRFAVKKAIPSEIGIMILPWRDYDSDDEGECKTTMETYPEMGRSMADESGRIHETSESSYMDESIDSQTSSITLEQEEELPARPRKIVELIKKGVGGAEYEELQIRKRNCIIDLAKTMRETGGSPRKLIRKWCDRDDDTRYELVTDCETVMGIAPEYAKEYVEILWTLCEDDVPEVCNEARKELARPLWFEREREDRTIDALLSLADSKPDSCRSSLLRFLLIVYGWIEGSQGDLDHFFSNLSLKYVQAVYKGATYSIAFDDDIHQPRQIEGLHLLHLMCLKSLQPPQVDKNELLKTIDEANRFPNKAAMMSVKLMTIPICHSRIWAPLALRKFVLKCPECTEEVFRILEQLTEVDEAKVAIEACFMSIPHWKGNPKKAQRIMSRFEKLIELEGCLESVLIIQGWVSLDELLSAYLECHNKLLIPFLVRQLFKTPVTVKTMSSGSTQVIVQTSSDSKKTYHFKTTGDPEAFRSIVEKCTERRFQEVAPLIWSGTSKRQNDAHNETPSSSKRHCFLM